MHPHIAAAAASAPPSFAGQVTKQWSANKPDELRYTGENRGEDVGLTAFLFKLWRRIGRRALAEPEAEEIGVDEEWEKEGDSDGGGTSDEAAEVAEEDVSIGEGEV